MQQHTNNDEIVFVDTEVSINDEKVHDLGAVRSSIPVNSTNGLKFHSKNVTEFEQFIKGATYICGHNIINFDLKYIMPSLERAEVRSVIDTLYLSPLLFPMKPYHKLLKDDKIQSEDLNNPLNDSIKAMELFLDEVSAFELLNDNMKKIYCTLLAKMPEFRGFFRYVNCYDITNYLPTFVQAEFKGKICANADIEYIAKMYPVELAYCLATIATGDRESILPYWVQKNYPKVQDVYRILCGVPCSDGCEYCRELFDIHIQLKKKFGFNSFRKYNDEPLQERAAQAAVDGKSLLAIFPTGGGKSITFQLPALIAAEATHGLTVVISPLQSLMKDQVDNLAEKGITDAVTINGLLNPVKNAQEAIERINVSKLFVESDKEHAVRIVKKLISTRSRAEAGNNDAESRVDYIADHLGIPKATVIEVVGKMRDEGILANDKEMYVYVESSALRARGKNQMLSRFEALEEFLVDKLVSNDTRINYKEINEEALNKGIKHSNVNSIRLLLHFWIIKGYIKKPEGELHSTMLLSPLSEAGVLKLRYEKRIRVAKFIEQYFVEQAREKEAESLNKSSILVNFSIVDIKRAYNESPKLLYNEDVSLADVEEALLYLSKINAYRIEGGFLVIYNAMDILRLEMDNKIRYKVEDYRQLKEFYDNKTQQIHIVGEFANMMVRDYDAALTFVNDYFQMEYKLFLTKYFRGSRMSEIARNITPMKYQMLFESLSERQSEIIEDDISASIVVAAGPGSGKTKILVHKLASLMLLEDVKHEQLLLLTFSRAAAMEFKMRLVELIGNAAHFVEIKTFHSYCFDLLGKIGNIENSKNVVKDATEMILNGEVELDRITKTVLVIDEAQDMDVNEYNLVRALMARNEDMRVIAVGDDDQNIYEFRGSDSKYMESLLSVPGAHMYELLQNYRSSQRVVWTSNAFAKLISKRMKQSEILPVKHEVGEVQIIRNASSLEMAAVNRLELSDRVSGLKEKTTAILTTTNEQAYLVLELLNRKGFKARLIQSNDGFSLYDLAEIRYFVNSLKAHNVPAITDEMWNKAKYKLQCVYEGSSNLKSCMYMIEQLDKISDKKYCTDVESFFREARFEDFFKADKNEICVSTIHKSKGREFDNVYMLVSQGRIFDDARKRGLYVGMTRAKSNLYVFHNVNYFNEISARLNVIGVQFLQDNNNYPEPEEIVMAMSHRDVNLSFFTEGNRSENVSELRAGMELSVKESSSGKYYRVYFSVMKRGKVSNVACCSSGFAERLQTQRQKGYVPYSAKVNYVVKWWNKEDEKEYSIVLPIIRLRKTK